MMTIILDYFAVIAYTVLIFAMIANTLWCFVCIAYTAFLLCCFGHKHPLLWAQTRRGRMITITTAIYHRVNGKHQKVWPCICHVTPSLVMTVSRRAAMKFAGPARVCRLSWWRHLVVDEVADGARPMHVTVESRRLNLNPTGNRL